jgi:hypothetical protein
MRKLKFGSLIAAAGVFAAVVITAPREARGAGGPAMDGEISAMASLSKTDYGNNTYTTSKRYTATLGVNLTLTTEIELSYSYTDSFLNQDPVQTTDTNEQTLGLSIVQSLVPPQFAVQPYAKVGVAQYNRRQTGTIAGIPTSPIETKSPSAILGAGLRVFLTRNFSLKAEGVTYLPNMHVDQGKNNFMVQAGVGWHF